MYWTRRPHGSRSFSCKAKHEHCKELCKQDNTTTFHVAKHVRNYLQRCGFVANSVLFLWYYGVHNGR